jgi:hypothetical protein
MPEASTLLSSGYAGARYNPNPTLRVPAIVLRQERFMSEGAVYFQGFAAALAEVCRSGQSQLVANILRANEITIGDLETAHVNERDLVVLRHALHPHADDTD